MAELAPVFVNEQRVRLQGEPKPVVRQIVRAFGKEPDKVQVFRTTNGQAEKSPLGLTETIDRTTKEDPIKLKVVEKSEKTSGVQSAPYQETPTPGVGTPMPGGTKSVPSPPSSPIRPTSPEPAPEPGTPKEEKTGEPTGQKMGEKMGGKTGTQTQTEEKKREKGTNQ